MKLALDIGNSRTKWGLFTSEGWVDKGDWETTQWMQLASLLQRTPAQVMAAHVADHAVKAGVTQCCAAAGVPLQWVNPNAPTPLLHSHYDTAQLGADRWAALIGARTLTQKNAVVVNAGTAAVDFTLPSAPGEGWRLQLDTTAPSVSGGKDSQAFIAVPARGLLVLTSAPVPA